MTTNGFTLRPYQREAVASIKHELAENDRTMLVCPTGTGKTVIFGHVIRDWPDDRRVLIMAHRDELIRQACDKVGRIIGETPDIEMGDYRADQRVLHDRSQVVVTSVQTMSRANRQQRFDPAEFGLLVVDEAHHAVSSTYQNVIEYFSEAGLKVLGVTATPNRADELALGRVFRSCVDSFDILRAIQEGWLVDIEQMWVHVNELDLSEVKTTAGDLNAKGVAEQVEKEQVLQETASVAMQEANGEPTLIYATTVKQAQRIAEIINRSDKGAAQFICGDRTLCPPEERRAILQHFDKGDFPYLVNCMVLVEGYDQPKVKYIVNARPTKSTLLYQQIIGRGTRPWPGIIDRPEIQTDQDRLDAIAASPKRCLTVVDMVGNCGRHQLRSTGDILGGDYETEIIASATQRCIPKQGRSERVSMLRELHREKKRAEDEAARRRVRAVAKAKYTIERVSPFEILGLPTRRERAYHNARKPTPRMVQVLTKAGIAVKPQTTFHEAGQLIGELKRRWDAKLCTFKQAKLLRKQGFDPDGMTMAQASSQIDAIAKSGWKLRGNYAGQ